MPFACSICGEESTHICARCTKDACGNHLCEKCGKCSDCCECEVHLAAPAAHVRPLDTEAEPAVEWEAEPEALRGSEPEAEPEAAPQLEPEPAEI